MAWPAWCMVHTHGPFSTSRPPVNRQPSPPSTPAHPSTANHHTRQPSPPSQPFTRQPPTITPVTSRPPVNRQPSHTPTVTLVTTVHPSTTNRHPRHLPPTRQPPTITHGNRYLPPTRQSPTITPVTSHPPVNRQPSPPFKTLHTRQLPPCRGRQQHVLACTDGRPAGTPVHVHVNVIVCSQRHQPSRGDGEGAAPARGGGARHHQRAVTMTQAA